MKKMKKQDESSKVDGILYSSLIESLLYLTATRLVIMYIVSLLSRFMQYLTQVHFSAVKHVLRYVWGTKNYRIWFKTCTNSKLISHTDNDWARSIDDLKSTSRYTFILGFGVFSWTLRKKESITQSFAIGEYVATTNSTS